MNAHLWTQIFLGCFLFGFFLTALSLLLGFGHHSGVHVGHDGLHFGHGGHHVGHAGHAGHGGHGGHGDHAGAHDLHGDGASEGTRFNITGFLNYNTILMFVTWFGAAGYLLLTSGAATSTVVFSGAIFSGFIGALIVFLFMHKFLAKAETRMDPSDYYMPGTLARITSSIREGGTGEIVYVQGGTRKTAGARSEEGVPHTQGEEVVIIRYEKGIAYVRSPTFKQHLINEPDINKITNALHN